MGRARSAGSTTRGRGAPRAAAGALLAASAWVTLAGCAQQAGPVEVGVDDLEARVRASVTETLGLSAAVTCPGPLVGEVGASTTCEVTTSSNGTREVRTLVVPASVTVADVTQDGTVSLDIAIEETPQEAAPPTADPTASPEPTMSDEASTDPAGPAPIESPTPAPAEESPAG